MITKQECEDLITNQYILNESLRDSPSTLKNIARWDNSEECFSYFWKSSIALNNFLKNININWNPSEHQTNDSETQNVHHSASTDHKKNMQTMFQTMICICKSR